MLDTHLCTKFKFVISSLSAENCGPNERAEASLANGKFHQCLILALSKLRKIFFADEDSIMILSSTFECASKNTVKWNTFRKRGERAGRDIEGKWHVRDEKASRDTVRRDRKKGEKGYETKCGGRRDRLKLVEMHRAFWQKSTLFTKRNTYGRHRQLAIVK